MTRRKADGGLTAMEATFLEELLKTPDMHSDAYRRALVATGKPVPQPNVLNRYAYVSLNRPAVAEAWEEMRRTRAVRVQVTTDMVLEELWGQIEVDATMFMSEDGGDLTVAELKALPKNLRRAIKSFERFVDKEGKVRFKMELWSREKWVELAGKHTGAWAKGESLIVQGDVNHNNVVYVIGVPPKAKDVETWTKKNAKLPSPR